MTDEEKIAFNYYKGCNEKDLENYEYLGDVSKKQAKYLESLLNLIEKQSKEIEELKGNDLRKDELVANMSTRHFHDREKIRKYEELQDKIKARIKELEEYLYRGNIKDDFLMIRIKAKIQELQSFLEKE